MMDVETDLPDMGAVAWVSPRVPRRGLGLDSGQGGGARKAPFSTAHSGGGGARGGGGSRGAGGWAHGGPHESPRREEHDLVAKIKACPNTP